ncbi:MAG: response regulator transcription factor [Flavobacteriales bacterium]|nr:response regulator transcription factor [Flavobacteriales bacterium]
MTKKDRARVLLVEDDLNLGFVIQDHLRNEGYQADLEKDGFAGFQKFYNHAYDLCILDVMLPKKDGFTLAEDIRKIDQQVPILFLTAKSMTEDKIRGFKLGADDYLTKPFSFDELDLRIKAIMKRSKPSEEDLSQDRDVFPLGQFDFDYKNLSLKHPEEQRTLTKKEAELLRMLCLHQDQVLTREMALTVVWGSDDYFLGRSMDVFITKLRKYLKLDERIKIMNVHGVGFKLIVDE